MKNTSEQIEMLKNLLIAGSISQKEYDEMLRIALLKSEKNEVEQGDPKENIGNQESFTEDYANSSKQRSEIKTNSTMPVIAGLMILFLLGLIVFVTLFIQTKAKLNLSPNNSTENNEIIRLIEEKEQKDQIIQNLEDQLKQISEFQPIFGSNLDFTNTNSAGESTNSNGKKCFKQSAIRYIYTSLNIHCLKPGKYTLENRIYEPNGVLNRSDGYSTANATYENEVELSKGFNDVDLSGWGSKTSSTYELGNNKVEIWCEGKLLAKSYFIVR
jgi:hypothetical protein